MRKNIISFLIVIFTSLIMINSVSAESFTDRKKLYFLPDIEVPEGTGAVILQVNNPTHNSFDYYSYNYKYYLLEFDAYTAFPNLRNGKLYVDWSTNATKRYSVYIYDPEVPAYSNGWIYRGNTINFNDTFEEAEVKPLYIANGLRDRNLGWDTLLYPVGYNFLTDKEIIINTYDTTDVSTGAAVKLIGMNFYDYLDTPLNFQYLDSNSNWIDINRNDLTSNGNYFYKTFSNGVYGARIIYNSDEVVNVNTFVINDLADNVITFDSTLISCEGGPDSRSTWIDFGAYVFSNKYHYQISLDNEVSYIDIELDNNNNYHVISYVNCILYARVLDENNNVVDQNSLGITDLSDYNGYVAVTVDTNRGIFRLFVSSISDDKGIIIPNDTWKKINIKAVDTITKKDDISFKYTTTNLENTNDYFITYNHDIYNHHILQIESKGVYSPLYPPFVIYVPSEAFTDVVKYKNPYDNDDVGIYYDDYNFNYKDDEENIVNITTSKDLNINSNFLTYINIPIGILMSVVQYLYNSCNIYIKGFLITIFSSTLILAFFKYWR